MNTKIFYIIIYLQEQEEQIYGCAILKEIYRYMKLSLQVAGNW